MLKVNTIYHGDALETLKTFPDAEIQTCITSPPYWGLRDYGTATWEGGEAICDHKGKPMATRASINQNCGTGNDVKNATVFEFYRETCGKCGARRIDRQLGLESTPQEYVEKMVAVFREVRRVLRDDGTLWLNVGDTYAADRSGTAMPAETLAGGVSGVGDKVAKRGRESSFLPHRDCASFHLKHKDLVGIPWMLAFALRDDGWWLRQDIIWHKPNPMPESVTDRCTKSHEYIFLMSKSARYYYDAKAIAEPLSYPDDLRGGDWKLRPNNGGMAKGTRAYFGTENRMGSNADGRNKRSVWTVATEPFPEAHFATFPEKLIEPCILAGSKPGDIVLDPFFGSGTVGKRSKELSRKWVGIELNAEYIKIANRRLCQQEIFAA